MFRGAFISYSHQSSRFAFISISQCFVGLQKKERSIERIMFLFENDENNLLMIFALTTPTPKPKLGWTVEIGD